METESKVVIVTGGSRGIGKAIVLAFSQQGTKVFFTYRKSEDKANEVETKAQETGAKVKGVKLDGTDFHKVKNFVDEIYNKEKRIDVLVNNAGIVQDALLVSMDMDDFKAVLDSNLFGTFNFIKCVVPYMVLERKGKIINISSVVGQRPGPGQINYSVSKACIDSLTKSLALELAHRNITVNAIAPGLASTDMGKGFIASTYMGKIISSIVPLRRLCNPEEIASLVIYLSSSKADYITGEVIRIDGGLRI